MSLLTRSAFITLAAFAFISCRSQDGDGNVVTQTLAVPAFSKLSVEDGLNVSVVRGDRQVSLTTDENLLGFYEFDVDGDTLKLRRVANFSAKSTGVVTVEVLNPVLEGLVVSGGSHVNADATPAADWRLTVKEGSTVSLSRIDTQDLRVEASGSSEADVFGVSRDVTIKASGGSRVNTDGVTAANVTINASDASEISVNAMASVKIDASGASQVSVTGNPPRRETDTTGGSQVNFQGQ